MKLFESKHLIALLGVLALVISGCASGGSKPTAQQFEAPKTVAEGPDQKLFSQALKAQNEGQFDSAIKLWKSFLSKHPKSFEGHNNLGLVYYAQDMVSQALHEFETAYRLNREDPKIRKNLARTLRFKASIVHENREYFKTLEILARLELIVEPEEKQGVLFQQEQVEDQIFLQVIKADNSAAYQDFINHFPDGLNAVRAREYLAENPGQSKKVSKVTSNSKSWISSGKAGDSWASSEKPPEYAASRPTAVYTPPPAGASKKTGDFFGADSAAVEKSIDEENVSGPQKVDPATAVPFEDFEKPERSSGEEVATKELTDGKENNRIASEFDPIREDPDAVTASLDTLPDLKPAPVEEALPEAVEVPKPDDTAVAGAIEMQPVEQEAETAGLAEAIAEQANKEGAKPEAPEMAQTENAGSETVESESERIARIVREEIERSESAQPAQEQPEPTQPEPAMEPAVESPQEEPMETASIDPVDQGVKEEMAPAEDTAVEETPPASEEKEAISAETVSETVAALMPSPPATEAMEAPVESSDSMVVVQMRKGATLNVRAKPSTQGEIMGYLEDGDMMPFVSDSGDWYQIEIDEEQSGWISKKYSTLKETTVAAAPTPTPEEPAPSMPTASIPVPEKQVSSELTPLGADPTMPENPMVVVTVSGDSTLNVRSLPSSDGAVVDMLFGGDKLPLIKEEGEWYQVRFEDETTGWISKRFSVIEGRAVKASLPAPQEKKADPKKASAQQSNEMITTVILIKVPEGSSLNVRSSPSPKGQVLDSLKSGDMRPLLEEADEWYQVELQNGQSGWVSRKFSSKMNVDSSFLQGP
jgi:uncharacterized protein YgiM (DUF1202 family)